MKMTEQEAKVYVKAQLKDWLESRGINTSKAFRCLSPAHSDRHASMSYHNNRVKCFACGFSGDLFDVLAMEENLSGRQLFKRAYELFGVETDDSSKGCRISAETEKKSERAEEDLSEYIAACAQRADQTDYFRRRGLSQAVVARFGLGFDPAFARSTGKSVWRAAVIPNGAGGYIARNTDPNADDRNRYRKAGKSRIFNADVFYEPSERPVWLVEGEIDALSLETVGSACAALGSVSNADQLIRMLENRRPVRRIIVAMDADSAGSACAEKLCAAFRLMKLEFMTAENPFCGKKDANEALASDRKAFEQSVQEEEMRFDTVARVEEIAACEEYERKFSAYGHLDAFLGEIAADTPCVPTTFKRLDALLGGGLFPGLVTIGAVSSLGKTTFCLQVADSIAAQGTDVLVFSLEMGAHELMARSISRLTLKRALEMGKNAAIAKSALDITVAARYNGYSDDELLLIGDAIAEYEGLSRRIFIVEGHGELGVREIRAAVETHIARTKRTPVVIVDYLQLIAPFAERLSDKQNTDKNVMELRRIARDLRLPLIAISSFSRANYNTAATMAAFKESGAIEYSSDVLMAMQYSGVGEDGFDLQSAMMENPRRVELLILKNRSGETGTRLDMKYFPKYNFFKEY